MRKGMCVVPDLRQITHPLLVALMALAAVPAQAANVTVGGIIYDIQFTQGNSFNDDSAHTTASPWWNSATEAQDFASAYGAQVTTPYPFDVTAPIDSLLFSYALTASGAENDAYRLSEDGDLDVALGLDNTRDLQNRFYAYSAGTVGVVPEINGRALSQAGLILLALWLGLRARRSAEVKRPASISPRP